MLQIETQQPSAGFGNGNRKGEYYHSLGFSPSQWGLAANLTLQTDMFSAPGGNLGTIQWFAERNLPVLEQTGSRDVLVKVNSRPPTSSTGLKSEVNKDGVSVEKFDIVIFKEIRTLRRRIVADERRDSLIVLQPVCNLSAHRRRTEASYFADLFQAGPFSMKTVASN